MGHVRDHGSQGLPPAAENDLDACRQRADRGRTLYLHTDYEIEPFKEVAVGNTPPLLGFDEKGPFVQGPLARQTEKTTPVGRPLEVTAWVSDDGKFTSGSNTPPRNLATRPPVTLTWSKYRGPGAVRFDKNRPDVQKLPGGAAVFNGKATISVTFSEPGEYVLHVTANDLSGTGGGGFQCCWTTALVKVSATP